MVRCIADHRLLPLRVGQHDRGVDRVVALPEDLGPDRDGLADRGLGRVGAALDDRGDLDHRDPVDQGAEPRWAMVTAVGDCGLAPLRALAVGDALAADWAASSRSMAGTCTGCRHGANLSADMRAVSDRIAEVADQCRPSGIQSDRLDGSRPLSWAGACNPTVHRPPRPARGPETARRAGPQPALELAHRHPGSVPLGRPEGVGQLRRRPDPAAGRRLGRAAADAVGGQEVPQEPADDPGRPGRVPHRRPLVPGLRRREPGRAQGDRLLLAGVRHHRGAAAVLRRPGHPGRRPPQGGQ